MSRSTPGLRFVEATEQDAGPLAALIRCCFGAQVAELAISEDEYPNYVGFETPDRVIHRMRGGDATTLAFVDEELVGTVSWRLRREDSRRGELLRLAILPELRGNGYGDDLVRYAENRLLELGAETIELSMVSRFTRLRAFYERLGYSVTGTGAVATLPFDVTWLERVLGV
jgi:ribosomal protein S18 acetylase RimI-like enzyme